MMNFLKSGTSLGLACGIMGTLAAHNPAAAMSSGCQALNSYGALSPTVTGGRGTVELPALSFEEGETIRFTWQNVNYSSPFVIDIAFSLYASADTTGPTLAQGETGSVQFTALGDMPNVTLFTRGETITGSLGVNDIIVTPSCSVASDPASGEGHETTSKAVTSAVSRSQTRVIQDNIGSRVATAIRNSDVNTVNPDTVGGDRTQNSLGDHTAHDGDDSPYHQIQFPGEVSIFDDDFDDHDDNNHETGDIMRSLAMRASFDSSEIAAEMARERTLALGPTDQGAIGGAAGVDGRASLTSASPITVWGRGSYTSIDNDYDNGTEDNRYDGDVWGYNLGADYRFENNVIAGLSVGYTDTDLTTQFNNGTYQESAWVVSPYAIFTPLQNLNIVAEAGYSQGDIDVTRDNDAVNGDTESTMWYGSLKAIYDYRPLEDSPLTLSPSVSFLASRKTIDRYQESDGTLVDQSRSNTRQLNPSLEAAYGFAFSSLTMTPFVEAGLVHDFTDELNNDANAYNIGGGVRLSDSLTGFNAALEGSYLAGRSDYTEYTISGTVSYGFELRDLDGQPIGFVSPFLGSNTDEYGNQSMRGGLGFDAGPMHNLLSFGRHSFESGHSESRAQISMSLDF
ncbi:autotransporter outer membrane beta-barrel domain-containing protein [Thalassospira sp. MA62]|nr:autotransporter outer membrane beta-barrel domain-containing protein [Thalassospira sp. MA62]